MNRTIESVEHELNTWKIRCGVVSMILVVVLTLLVVAVRSYSNHEKDSQTTTINIGAVATPTNEVCEVLGHYHYNLPGGEVSTVVIRKSNGELRNFSFPNVSEMFPTNAPFAMIQWRSDGLSPEIITPIFRNVAEKEQQ